MKLNRVDIKNFRSIKNIEIDFNPSCRILVGINESGKSNILEALALLSDDYKPVKKDDLREALPDDGELIKESYVRFVFKFEKEESDKLFDFASSKILASVKNPDIIYSKKGNKNIKEVCAIYNEGLYSVNILEEKKLFMYWKLPVYYKLLAGWKKPTAVCPQDFSVDLKGQQYKLAQYKFIRVSDFPDIPEGYLEDANINELVSIYGGAVVEITKANLPDTLFWEYDENNLLPNSIKIAEFAANPDLCTPLKNMFTLAGIENIRVSIEDAQKRTENQFQNYLDRIAKKTTIHFRNVWKEYKNIEFSLRLNADQIIPGVKEKNIHDFARRSDGFKRFVTFLLMISVNVKIDNMRDTLLLIDEPEMGLHPTGARYLRDELIRISKTNYVVYSTHSIFMIDSGDISRHFIVKKNEETTDIEVAKISNITDEEVLYNALGYSIFASLKQNNIIFEGWNDKCLFCIVFEKASADIKKKYKDVGFCHARGVKSIKAITPMIELAKRKCLIISDSDKPAKEQQKIYQREKCFGDWKTYQDIDSMIEAITGEDFIKNDFIAKQVKAILPGTLPEFNESVLPNKKGKLVAIFNWLITNGMTKDQAESKIVEIKNSIFDNLEYSNIDKTEYTKLFQGISQEF